MTEPPRPSVAADSTASPPAAGQGDGGGTGGPVDEQVDKPATEVAADKVEPYVVKGRVLDPQGNPLAGVTVQADNTLFHDSYLLAVSDADGGYRIDLSALEATWVMFGATRVEFDGRTYGVHLQVDESSFASREGAIRDFVWQLSGEHPSGYGHYGAKAAVYEAVNHYDIEDMSWVTLVFEPDGPLVDGSVGETVRRQVDFGWAEDIPLGRYTVSAILTPPGAAPQPLLISVVGTDEFTESVTTGFEEEVEDGGAQYFYVKLPD